MRRPRTNTLWGKVVTVDGLMLRVFVSTSSINTTWRKDMRVARGKLVGEIDSKDAAYVFETCNASG
jgi:hypothetical protein